MSYSFEYIDIILLAMIAGFIFLRLRGILGKRTGFEGKAAPQFEEILNSLISNKATKEAMGKINKEYIYSNSGGSEKIIKALKTCFNKR